jgi:hypothetical protein
MAAPLLPCDIPNPGDTITKRPKEFGHGNGQHPFESDALCALVSNSLASLPNRAINII